MKAVKLIFLVFFICKIIAADSLLTIVNHTNKPVFAGLYYVNTTLFGKSIGPANRPDGISCVMPNEGKKLKRPPYQFKRNREIIFSYTEDDLPAMLAKKEYRVSSKKTAGITQGNIYHIIQADGILKILENREWNILCKTEKQMHVNHVGPKEDCIISQEKQAFVRQGSALNQDEQAAVDKRMVNAKKCLEGLLGIPMAENHVPRIALCLSGGGMRAATCSLGLVKGLNIIGLLDAVVWVAALSGSSWFISHYCQYNKSVTDYNKLYFDVAGSIDSFSLATIKEIFNIRFHNDCGSTVIDWYGSYLCHKFFRNISSAVERQRLLFSSLRESIDLGLSFIPLCTAVEMTYSRHNPIWYTFTPYEIGSEELGLYVPTWSFGRKFFDGESTNNVPEKPLSFYMGLWGSALSGTFKQLFDHAMGNGVLSSFNIFCKKILKQTIGPVRFAPIKVCNPFYGKQSSIYKNLSYLNFVDAGYHVNLPLRPLLNSERAVDVIIILDASRKVQYKEGAYALRKAYQDIECKGFPFPKIDLDHISKNSVNVFFDHDRPEVPLVIYIPVFKNLSHPEFPDPAVEFFKAYNTSHFTYSKMKCERLVDLVSCNVFENKDVILDALKLKIKQKQTTGLSC